MKKKGEIAEKRVGGCLCLFGCGGRGFNNWILQDPNNYVWVSPSFDLPYDRLIDVAIQNDDVLTITTSFDCRHYYCHIYNLQSRVHKKISFLSNPRISRSLCWQIMSRV
ncbi:hypothetical protein AQUCO_00400425v1 [Aquilegia coerulea]|uniref:Uncharacterized protein n=1 Tax=Aquilegia coerulea TaxID=218851 RepID=A0A2G5EUU0_AQUCA|nr:hypothetical protein AQUCO_00400425v1 [Aquilegia coerulea]